MLSPVSSRLEKQLFFTAVSSWSSSNRRRINSTRTEIVRFHRITTPSTSIAELSIPETALDVAVSIPTEPQTFTIAVIAAVSAVCIVAFALAWEQPSSGSVVGISTNKLESILNQKETLVIDIRSKAEVKEEGSPSLKRFRIKQKPIPYYKRDREGNDVIEDRFGELVSKTKGLKEDSLIVLLDSDGRSAPTAAREILSLSDFETVYYVSGGATAMQASGFEWKAFAKPFSFSLPKIDLKGLDIDKIAETYKKRPTLINTGVGVGALATASVVLFNEFDVVLEAVGVLGVVNFFLQRLLFAEEREKTLKAVRSLFNDKIAANEAGDDLKRLASAILETEESSEEEYSSSVPSNDKVPASETLY